QDQRWSRFYERSGEGDVRAIHDSARGVHRFSYDAAHRLIGEALPSGSTRTFTYSLGGTLVEAPGLTDVTVGHQRIATANGSRLEYDDRDNLCARHAPTGTYRLTHDADDQLVAMEEPSFGRWSARYDMLGRRVETTFNGQTTTFYWDTDRLAAEILPDGRLRVYVYPDTLALTPMMFVDYANVDADPESGKRYFVFSNHLGAPEIVEDDAGNVVWRARYEAYGTAHIEVGADFHQPLRWPGHYLDAATGLHYVRFRYYSPELGQFIESDPQGISGGYNVHAYGDGNPLRYVDVQGLATGCPKTKKPPKKKQKKPRTKPALKPLEADTYRNLNKKTGKGKLDRDHMPSFAAVKAKMNAQRKAQGRPKLNARERENLRNNLNTLSMKSGIHREGRTYGSKNKAQVDGKPLYERDSGNLKDAAKKDMASARKNLVDAGHDPKDVNSSLRKLDSLNKENGVYDDPLPESLIQPSR
ncbi:MAG TPA: RHS repeat-associated core domain-containing protein, partial [Polyangiaceae bacterium]|nr:RHS repeat-associated core domain-containing protein [Polyangiaceae bacterium]